MNDDSAFPLGWGRWGDRAGPGPSRGARAAARALDRRVQRVADTPPPLRLVHPRLCARRVCGLAAQVSAKTNANIEQAFVHVLREVMKRKRGAKDEIVIPDKVDITTPPPDKSGCPC